MTSPARFHPMPYHGGEHTVELATVTQAREYTFLGACTHGPQLYHVEVRYTGDPGLHLTDEDLGMIGHWITGTLHGRDLATVLETTPTLHALAATIFSLALAVLEARASTGHPAPCHQAEVTVRDSTGTSATVSAPLPILTTGGPA